MISISEGVPVTDLSILAISSPATSPPRFFNSKPKASENLLPIIKSLKKIDATIEKSAPLWPIAQINRIDLAILRLAVYELLLNSTPEKVAVDEAVELAKEFGSDSSPSFVNGVLGAVLDDRSK